MKTALWLSILVLAAGSACSVRRFAVNQVGNAFAGSGTTFSSDEDPELVREAVPFALKLQESLLAESPRHAGLLLATASGFTQYAYGFVQQDADEMESRDVARAKELRDRARRLYHRARHYGLRGLEVAHPGLTNALTTSPATALRQTTREDVPLLYWTAAAWGAAISLSKDRPESVADLPQVAALIERARELHPDFDRGAIHSFLISFEMARPGTKPDVAAARARHHFERARQLSGGKLAGPLVAYAEAVAVQQQNRAEFTRLLNEALAIDVDEVPESRLANTILQRRARWLLSKVDELFLE